MAAELIVGQAESARQRRDAEFAVPAQRVLRLHHGKDELPRSGVGVVAITHDPLASGCVAWPIP